MDLTTSRVGEYRCEVHAWLVKQQQCYQCLLSLRVRILNDSRMKFNSSWGKHILVLTRFMESDGLFVTAILLPRNSRSALLPATHHYRHGSGQGLQKIKLASKSHTDTRQHIGIIPECTSSADLLVVIVSSQSWAYLDDTTAVSTNDLDYHPTITHILRI